MTKSIFSYFFLFTIGLFLIGCEDDDDNSSGMGGTAAIVGIQFSEDERPIYTRNTEVKVVISGGVMPYNIKSTDINNALIVKDTLKFINPTSTTPTLLAINIEDDNDLAGQFSFVSSPNLVYLDMESSPTEFYPVAVGINNLTGLLDTIGNAIDPTMTYIVEEKRFILSSSTSNMGYSDLFFNVNGSKNSNTTVNSVRFIDRSNPIGFPRFPGNYILDNTKTQECKIGYNFLGIPESLEFNFNLNDSTLNPLNLYTESKIDLRIF